MPALESRVEGVWFGKQTAKGTPALASATTNKRIRKVGGDINVNRSDGSENYSDGQRFGDAADFVDTIVGEGAPVAQATADMAGYLSYLLLGSETVTGAGDPYTHVAVPGTTGFWFTVWKLVGSTSVLRQRFSDCRMTSLRIEGSSANKVVKLTPTFTSITDPGEVFTTDPVAVSSTENPLLYTEGEGRFSIDGAVFSAHSSFAIVLNDPTPPWYGDSTGPGDVTFGIANVVLEGITILVNQQGLDRYNTIVYGTASPTAGTKPRKDIPALGSYTVDLQRPGAGASMTGAGARQLLIEVPGVKWSPDLAIAGNPDGGPVELALAGEARKSGSSPRVRITTKSADIAYV